MTSTAVRYVRRPGLDAVEMDGELVMMGLEQGEYFGMRGVAASIWQHLDEPRNVDELCTLVAEEYETTPAECRPDVDVFVGDLVARRLVDTAG
jgi:hypothetical protein